MALYTRWGIEIEIVAHCGVHRREGCRHSETLMQTRRKDTSRIRYHFAEYLLATDGFEEIARAVVAAPKMELDGEELAEAIQWALF